MYQHQTFKAMDIKRSIKANGLTVKEVAERMGITPVGLSQHINGNPSVEVLERIAAAIGCNVGIFRPSADEHDNVSEMRYGVRGQRKEIIMEQELILYNSVDGKSRVSLLARDGSVWLNQAQIAELLPPLFPISANI